MNLALPWPQPSFSASSTVVSVDGVDSRRSRCQTGWRSTGRAHIPAQGRSGVTVRSRIEVRHRLETMSLDGPFAGVPEKAKEDARVAAASESQSRRGRMGLLRIVEINSPFAPAKG
jgi:hypothetical protein